MYEQLRKVQLVELDILKKVTALCEKHNIEYFAAWGTLLGAVRHKGFIPWDDDMDIMMPRPDYEKFCEIAEKELEYPYFLLTNQINKAYNLHFAKVQNLGTTFIEKGKSNEIEAGIFIDIFPIDGFKRGIIYKELCKLKYEIYKYCSIDFVAQQDYPGKKQRRFLGKLLNWLLFGSQSPQYFFEKTEKLFSQVPYEQTDYLIDMSDKCRFDKKLLQGDVYIDFEDMKLRCPKEYDALLRLYYGDYMQLPPQDKRHPSHGVIVDTEKSYKQYIKNAIGE